MNIIYSKIFTQTHLHSGLHIAQNITTTVWTENWKSYKQSVM